MTKISRICVFVFWTVTAFGQNAPNGLQSLIEEARQNNVTIKAAERASRIGD
jgi:hypothetical protein